MFVSSRALQVATGLFLGFAASHAVAQDADQLCTLRVASDVIKIAICSDTAPDEVLAEEGRRICGGDLPCGTWFWLSAEDAPAEAPENHDGLTAEQVTSAMGVYVAEDEMLVRIEPDGN